MIVSGVEWTGAQQVSFLLDYTGLGLLFGLVFDVLEGLQPFLRGHRVLRFLADSLLGLLAALVTFFVALATMDGVLHPLLFGGILLGAVTEHLSIGRRVAALTRRAGYRMGRIRSVLLYGRNTLGRRLSAFFLLKKTVAEKNAAFAEKNRKKSPFFQKKA